ncbi:MAG: sensor histidine kinase [Chitinispirillaceae bacterium]
MKKVSLFTKFTITILASAVAIAVTTHAALFVHFSQLKNSVPLFSRFNSHARFLVDRADFSDSASVSRILAEQGLEFRYDGQDDGWTTSKHVPTRQELIEKSSSKRLDEPAFWHNNRLVTVVETDTATYIFQGMNPFEQLSFPWEIFLLWSGVLVVIIGLTHLKIRHLLRPVKVLKSGVQQVSRGNFDIDLVQNTNDELGQLIRSFNEMAGQIRKDIKARDQLLRDISHELRSPLARMLVALEFVPQGNIRDSLKNNITILEKMTSGILEEERLDSPYGKVKREVIDLGALITEIVESKKQTPPSITLGNNGPLEFAADTERLRMALSNIIDNALKYSRPESRPVYVDYRREDQKAVITVRDWGIGIAEEEIAYIFEPFYRVDKARRHDSGGYGLGMSLTKKIVEAHGGTIQVESMQHKGTTVTITLPAPGNV